MPDLFSNNADCHPQCTVTWDGMVVQFENAINEYSLALKIVRDPAEEARLLSNRSGAFARCVYSMLTMPTHPCTDSYRRTPPCSLHGWLYMYEACKQAHCLLPVIGTALQVSYRAPLSLSFEDCHLCKSLPDGVGHDSRRGMPP